MREVTVLFAKLSNIAPFWPGEELLINIICHHVHTSAAKQLHMTVTSSMRLWASGGERRKGKTRNGCLTRRLYTAWQTAFAPTGWLWLWIHFHFWAKHFELISTKRAFGSLDNLASFVNHCVPAGSLAVLEAFPEMAKTLLRSPKYFSYLYDPSFTTS